MIKKKAVFMALMLIVAMVIPAMSWSAPSGPGDMPPDDAAGGPMGQYGDGRDMGPEGRPGGAPSKERMEQVRKKIEMVRIWKLTEALNLDEKTAEKLFPILRKYDKQKMELQREKFSIMRQVRQADSDRQEGKVDSAAILKKLEDNRTALVDLEKKQSEELKKVLTPEQMVKYMAFEESFRREMKQMLRESRGAGGEGGGGRDESGRRPGMRRPGPDGDGGPPTGMDGGMRDDRRRR